MSFDEIIDLTADIFFNYNMYSLGVQRSLTVVRPSQAFHDDDANVSECRMMSAIYSTIMIVSYGTCTENRYW